MLLLAAAQGHFADQSIHALNFDFLSARKVDYHAVVVIHFNSPGRKIVDSSFEDFGKRGLDFHDLQVCQQHLSIIACESFAGH